MFKVPDLFQWVIIATGSKQIEELYKAPENILSSVDANVEASSISCDVLQDCSRTHAHTHTHRYSNLIIPSAEILEKIHTTYPFSALNLLKHFHS